MKVFVTSELYPFTHGGIGRVIANILATATQEERNRIIVACVSFSVDQARFEQLYKGVKFISIQDHDYQCVGEDGEQYPPLWAYTDTMWHGRSVNVMQALKKLERKVNIEYIEFPDWGGLGFACIQEKKLGKAFENAILAVRLHSTDSVLASVESRNIDLAMLNIYALERKSIADCDLIVGQLAPVAQGVSEFFGLDTVQFSQRLVIDPPPVVVDFIREGDRSVAFAQETPIVFSSKLQELKKPDIFIRGVAGFMKMTPEYKGKAFLLAHSFNKEYQEALKSLVPTDLQNRFCFLDGCSGKERDEIISTSICIFPSYYESFCLAAYEASISGALVLLNESNPAFGKNTPWLHDANCLKFNGSALHLARILAESWKNQAQTDRVKAPASKALSLELGLNERVTENLYNESPLVSVLIPHFNLGRYLINTLDSVNSCSYGNIEIIVVDDCSTDPVSIELLNKLEKLQQSNLKIVKNPFNIGLSATRNHGLTHAAGKYIVTLDADDILGVDYIKMAVNALEFSADYDFVVTPAAYFTDDKESSLQIKHDYSDYAVFTGEAVLAGLYQNRFSTATVFGRKSAFFNLQYDEALTCYEDWEFFLRANVAGYRFLVTSDIHFFYRKRLGSMVNTEKDRHEKHLDAILRSKFATMGQLKVPLYHLNYKKFVHNDTLSLSIKKVKYILLESFLSPSSIDRVRKKAYSIRDYVRRLRGKIK